MDKNIKRLYFYCGLLLFFNVMCSVCFATTEIYIFSSAAQKTQFQQMILELRCLVCQNQNIADSNAPLAQDLRNIIYQQIKRGETRENIKKYLVNRYGEYILFKPLFSPLTYLLWFGPFLLLIIIITKLVIGMRI